MVDGVLASCYADCQHDLAHLTMTPMRRFSEMIEWIFGDGGSVPVFVNIAEKLGTYLAFLKY